MGSNLSLKTEWFKDSRNQDDTEKLKKSIIGSKLVLDKLIEICYNIKKSLDHTSYDYDCPSWAYKQAHINGQKEMLERIISLCTITERP